VQEAGKNISVKVKELLFRKLHILQGVVGIGALDGKDRFHQGRKEEY